MGLCGGDAPDPPDYTALANATTYAANRAFDLGQAQIDWSREQWTGQKALLDQIVDQQVAVSKETLDQARSDRERYESRYQPIEDDLIRDFTDYGTESRKTLEAGRAAATVTQSANIQRQEALRRLEGYGVDPSQTRSQALDLQARIATAGQAAGASNAARERVEDKGRALRAEAINIGRGYPSQVAASYGQTLNAGNSAIGNTNSTLQSQSNMYNQGLGFYQAGQAGLGQTANIMNTGFQNQMAAYEADQSLGGLGQLAGIGIGAFAGSLEAGGEVPGDMSAIPGPTDRHPVLLADDEYVIPAEVVKWKGLEFFDKLTAKSRADQGLNEVPAGEPATGATPQALPTGMQYGGPVPQALPTGMQYGGPVPQARPAPQVMNYYNPNLGARIVDSSAALAAEGAALVEGIRTKRAAEMGSAITNAQAGMAISDRIKEKKDKKEEDSTEGNKVNTDA